MTDTTLELLAGAANEIRNLRRINDILSAKVEMFDKCLLLLGTVPNVPSRGMSPDLLHEIEQHVICMSRQDKPKDLTPRDSTPT